MAPQVGIPQVLESGELLLQSCDGHVTRGMSIHGFQFLPIVGRV